MRIQTLVAGVCAVPRCCVGAELRAFGAVAGVVPGVRAFGVVAGVVAGVRVGGALRSVAPTRVAGLPGARAGSGCGLGEVCPTTCTRCGAVRSAAFAVARAGA